MSKPKRASEVPDRRSGGYFLFPWAVMESEAWRAASPLAVKILFALCRRHNGHNNGRITLSQREASAITGCQNFHAIGRAFGELDGLGLAVVAVDHPKRQRLAREYRLTFVPCGSTPATNEYLSWQPGDAGTRKKRVAPTAAETSLSAEATAARPKLSAEATAADGLKSANFSKVSAEDGSTHIINHPGSPAGPVKDRVKNAGGPRKASDSVASAAPSPTELRARAAAHIERFGRGSQSRLAEQSKIPPGTFSRFIHHDGPLNEQARIRLACAFPKTEAAERITERISA